MEHTPELWQWIVCFALFSSFIPGTTGVTLRLVGGTNAMEGRVEIISPYVGTVCDDHWDAAEARVVCRMLGFPCGNAIAKTSGGGTGAIVLDNVKCRGGEDDIGDCPHNAWNSHDCSHAEDAGVTCGVFPDIPQCPDCNCPAIPPYPRAPDCTCAVTPPCPRAPDCNCPVTPPCPRAPDCNCHVIPPCPRAPDCNCPVISGNQTDPESAALLLKLTEDITRKDLLLYSTVGICSVCLFAEFGIMCALFIVCHRKQLGKSGITRASVRTGLSQTGPRNDFQLEGTALQPDPTEYENIQGKGAAATNGPRKSNVEDNHIYESVVGTRK